MIPGAGRESLVVSGKSGDQESVDMDHHHREYFNRITNEAQMKATVNNDDIFWGAEVDRNNK